MSNSSSNLSPPVVEWSVEETKCCLKEEGFEDTSIRLLCDENRINGKVLLALNEGDFTTEPLNKLSLRERKCLYIFCKCLQRENQGTLLELGILENPHIGCTAQHHYHRVESEFGESENISPPISEDGRFGRFRFPAEKIKTFLSFLYVVAVTWITAFVMVIVHDRVPDMDKYPPLPDIFLDNVPHIPWAFDMCEITGTFLFTIFLIVLLFHKHRFILMRRIFALSGTVFLLRCVTMLITSLSVPGAHLQCQPRTYVESSSKFESVTKKLQQAWVIWRGAGMSIQGVRTCGDYMFSGHTVALTMLNFFITEYTPRYMYSLHTLTWVMNMFGIFFILAAHEHYSIDVFVAFYITSRLFLYYHTLANNQALMQRDSVRTRIWFPLFSYFEANIDGIVPNEFETPGQIANNIVGFLKETSNEILGLVLNFNVRKKISNRNSIGASTSGNSKNRFSDQSSSNSKSKKD